MFPYLGERTDYVPKDYVPKVICLGTWDEFS